MRARSIASERPRGFTAKASRAAESCTTVSLRRLSTIAAATRPYTGVSMPSKKGDARSVCRGKGTTRRRSLRWRAYSRITSA